MAGLLYVTMQPSPELGSQFTDWYQNEHGPLRLRLPFVENGFRYRAVDAQTPEWLALYDITDMQELTRESYLVLRGDGIRTTREKDTMGRTAVGRRLYDTLQDQDRQIPGYRALDQQPDTESAGAVLLANTMKVKPGDPEDDFNRWYAEEHIPMLSRVPGWRRSRRFVTSVIDSAQPKEYLALHEFAAVNGLGGAEHNASVDTPWRTKVMDTAVLERTRRVYQWTYTFGPAPRELHSLRDVNGTQPWSSNDGRTRTVPSTTRPAVESFVTTADGVDLPYRLEGGSEDANAPVIVLSNSILVDWSVWDGFVDAFFANPKNHGFRILRYLTRGRLSKAGEQPINIDVLANDVITLLDALRVPAATLIGVSLGGVTVLNTALLHPSRVQRFIACDTNSSSPESNRKAWNDRIVMAEGDKAVSDVSGEAIVGETLADATTRRWFFDDSLPQFAHVKEVVHNNSLEGFRRAAQALCAYDVRERMAQGSVPGLFVAGSGDGVLPQTMGKMAEDYKLDAELKIVDKAGHLPMVEQPHSFAQLVNGFIH